MAGAAGAVGAHQFAARQAVPQPVQEAEAQAVTTPEAAEAAV
jgi:hypothetical protein